MITNSTRTKASEHIRLLRGYTRGPETVNERAPEPTDSDARPSSYDNRCDSPGSSLPDTREHSRVLESRRVIREYKPRSTAFAGAHRALAEILHMLPADATTRVVIVGTPGGGTIEGLRRWTHDTRGGQWEAAPRGHYLEDPRRAVLRYHNTIGGGSADIVMAAGWFGDADGADQIDKCREAWETIAALGVEHFSGGPMLNSPAATGREWWQRTIPAGRAYPVLDTETAGLIRATSGQGRIEMLGRAPDEIPRLIELDGRLMYGSLCWALPVGLRIHDECQPEDYSAHVRARYRVKVIVPREWNHVGLLGVRSPEGSWSYPNTPGEIFETWADGAELHVCTMHGWAFTPLERMVFGEGKPLDKWANLLGKLAIEATDPLVRAGLRSILLHGIGAFHSGGRKVTKTLPVERAGEVPPDAENPRIEGPVIAWSETKPVARPELHHPEWTAAIWARARARLLWSKNLGVGALRLPVESLVAFRTDAIWTTADPGWADDGKPGRFRVKSIIEGPIAAPRTSAELLALRAAAAGE